jgi:hypothetical protein
MLSSTMTGHGKKDIRNAKDFAGEKRGAFICG